MQQAMRMQMQQGARHEARTSEWAQAHPSVFRSCGSRRSNKTRGSGAPGPTRVGVEGGKPDSRMEVGGARMRGVGQGFKAG